MQTGADKLAQQSEDAYREAMGELLELTQATDPEIGDLPEDQEERDALIAQLHEQLGDLSQYTVDDLVSQGMGADLPPRLREAFDATIDELESAGPGEGHAILRRAAALLAWRDHEYQLARPLMNVLRRSEKNLGPRGALITTTYSDGRRTVQRITGEEIAQAEETQRQQEDEQRRFPYGRPDRVGTVTLKPEDVSRWPADRFYSFSRRYPDLADTLLKGLPVRCLGGRRRLKSASSGLSSLAGWALRGRPSKSACRANGAGESTEASGRPNRSPSASVLTRRSPTQRRGTNSTVVSEIRLPTSRSSPRPFSFGDQFRGAGMPQSVSWTPCRTERAAPTWC
jgi:hypothetical protein